jgi:hypothetical protein
MIISACLTAADEVSALSLIKSTEYPKLSAILFGEGVVNDAISILLFHSVVTTKRLGGSGDMNLHNATRFLLGGGRGGGGTDDDDDGGMGSSDDDDFNDDVASYTDAPSPAHHSHHSHTLSPTPAATLPAHATAHQLMDYWDVEVWKVLSTTCKTLVMAVVVGVGSGLVIARLLKIYPEMAKSPVHQTAIIALGAYISFCVSDALEYVVAVEREDERPPHTLRSGTPACSPCSSRA